MENYIQEIEGTCLIKIALDSFGILRLLIFTGFTKYHLTSLILLVKAAKGFMFAVPPRKKKESPFWEGK
jgi:hypothetical protein